MQNLWIWNGFKIYISLFMCHYRSSNVFEHLNQSEISIIQCQPIRCECYLATTCMIPVIVRIEKILDWSISDVPVDKSEMSIILCQPITREFSPDSCQHCKRVVLIHWINHHDSLRRDNEHRVRYKVSSEGIDSWIHFSRLRLSRDKSLFEKIF